LQKSNALNFRAFLKLVDPSPMTFRFSKSISLVILVNIAKKCSLKSDEKAKKAEHLIFARASPDCDLAMLEIILRFFHKF
jgi:hypothetical protein